MKSKFVFGLLAAMLVLALAPSSFAQVSITINNAPSPQEVQTNRTAETSDPASAGAGITVSGALVAQSDLTVTNLVLTFPSQITSDAATTTGGTGVPAGDPIRIEGATGVFATATIVTKSSTTLTIALFQSAGQLFNNNQSGSFRIIGTRINANGLTAPATATASLSSSANNFFLNTTQIPLITALGPGIGSVTQGNVSGRTDETTIQVFTNRNVTDARASVVITEGFASAWRSEAQNEIDAPGAAGVGPSQIRLTVAGVPSGATLTYTVEYVSSGNTLTISAGTTGTFTSTTTQRTLTIGASSLSTVESFQLTFELTPTTLATSPTAGSITVTATMAPNPPSTSTGANDLNATTPVPTYTVAEVGPATIGSIVAANTTLLVSYALRQGAFDTGIQISNTTADPFGATTGGATATAGNLIFDFFPRNPAGGAGTPFQLSTSSSTVFGGLSSDGTLAAGGTFVALLSEILSRTSFTGDFSGYIFVRANFLGAHGNATISDFRTYSLATNVLVLRPPASSPRNIPANGAEGLDH